MIKLALGLEFAENTKLAKNPPLLNLATNDYSLTTNPSHPPLSNNHLP